VGLTRCARVVYASKERVKQDTLWSGLDLAQRHRFAAQEGDIDKVGFDDGTSS
jgi:hypothetical protein